MNNCKSYVFNHLLEKIYLLRNILNDSFYVILTYLHNKIIVNNTKKPGMKKRTKSKYNVSEHPYKKKRSTDSFCPRGFTTVRHEQSM